MQRPGEIALCLCLCFCFFVPGVEPLLAREKDEGKEQDQGKRVNPDGYDRYLDLRSAKYVNPSPPGSPGVVRLAFDVSRNVPVGTKITFSLLQYDLPVIRMNYLLKKGKRKGVALKWVLKEKLAPGQYSLRTSIVPKRQSRAVQRQLKKKAKRFPSKVAPWRWLYLEKPIVVGGKGGSPCEAYTDLMDKLVDHLEGFLQKMERAKAAEEFVSGGGLDVTEFTSYVIKWREEQGEIQREIRVFPENHMALFQQAQQEYHRLVNLSRMVSKYSIDVQREVTEQYEVEEIKPKSSKWFLKTRTPVDYDSLARNYDLIREGLNCPEEEGDEAVEGDSESTGKKAPKRKAKTDG